ncbi:MAG: hypothetical protein C4527_28695 [Candidatus Omnitrophota bacterium]|jgi:hypothetical protein|nr:MAG: hypothetical protein C4527_28695 [Candidatus Omnitrophota bacterium]
MLENLWKFFDNRKTTIGASFLLAAMIIERFMEIWWGTLQPEWIPKLLETLQWLGGLFTGVGLTHKGWKSSGINGSTIHRADAKP